MWKWNVCTSIQSIRWNCSERETWWEGQRGNEQQPGISGLKAAWVTAQYSSANELLLCKSSVSPAGDQRERERAVDRGSTSERVEGQRGEGWRGNDSKWEESKQVTAGSTTHIHIHTHTDTLPHFISFCRTFLQHGSIMSGHIEGVFLSPPREWGERKKKGRTDKKEREKDLGRSKRTGERREEQEDRKGGKRSTKLFSAGSFHFILRLWYHEAVRPSSFLSQNSSSKPDLMSLKVGPSAQSSGIHLWMLLCPLLCAVVMAEGSTLSPEDLQSTGANSLPEDWIGTTIQLQPDLQTEAQTQAEAQTDALTDTATQSTTSNYTG